MGPPPSPEVCPLTDRDFSGRAGLSGPPQLGVVIQGVDQLGCQLDVVAQDLLVLRDAVHVADAPREVPIHPGAQFAVPHLEERTTQGTEPNRSLLPSGTVTKVQLNGRRQWGSGHIWQEKDILATQKTATSALLGVLKSRYKILFNRLIAGCPE